MSRGNVGQQQRAPLNIFALCCAQKAAAGWLKTLYTNPDNETFQPFFDTLPPLGSVLAPEMWPPELIEELQAPDSLVRIGCNHLAIP